MPGASLIIPDDLWRGFRLDHVYWLWYRKTGVLESYDTSKTFRGFLYLYADLTQVLLDQHDRQLQLFRP